MVKLIWSPKSLEDLKTIFDYISADSGDYAHVFVRKLIESATTIGIFPLSGRVVPEFESYHVREKIYRSYRILYRFKNHEVEIVTVYHHARQLTEGDV